MKLGFPYYAVIGFVVVIAGSILYRVFLPYDPDAQSLFNQPNNRNSTEIAAKSENGTPGTFKLLADQAGWQPLGKGPLAITAVGTIDLGGSTATADGTKIPADSAAPAPGLPLGVLVAKIGENGKPFNCKSKCKIAAMDQIFITINDSTYDDNQGFYVITVLKEGSEAYPE